MAERKLDWDLHKDKIMSLYHTHTREQIREKMKADYGFDAR